MTPALAYAPRRSALGQAGAPAATIHLWSFAVIAFVVSNPIVLAGCALAVACAGLAAGAARALALAARSGAVLAVLIVAVNALASQRGATILFRGPEVPLLGTIDVSAEALAEGGVLALRIAIVIAVFAVHSACVDPDRLLHGLRPLARRTALTASLIARLVPLAATDRERLRDAEALRGPAAAPVGRVALARRLVAGTIDRAVDVAASLELRGYPGAARTGARPRGARAPGDLGFALTGVLALGLAAGARVSGTIAYESYPLVALQAGTGALLVAAALPACTLLPLVARRLRGPRPARIGYARA